MTTQNPYQPPGNAAAPSNLPPAERDKLREIARYQRNINLVILCYFGAGFLIRALNELAVGRIVGGVIAVGVLVAGAYFAVMMARALYSTAVAVISGILLLVPCVGLLTLLVLNNRATARLGAAGIKVGLIGADPSEIARVLGPQ